MNAIPKFVRPLVTAGSHPVETGRYVIATPAVCQLYDAVKQWIANRVPGGMIYGKQRFGKTRAIKYLVDQLPVDFGPKLAIFALSMHDYRLPTENTFFEDMLYAVGHAFTKGKASAKRNRLIEFLHERAAEGGSRLIMILDEAQKLHEIQYRWLVDLHNELDERGVTVTWLLVGQNELLHQREVFVTSKRLQIIGRFMVHLYSFTGLRSIEDFKRCLECYDDGDLTDHPRGSGWSFTRYFFPAAFENGWRLATQAETLWDVFAKVRAERRLPGKAEVPMQYFVGTVDYILRTYGSLQEVPGEISINMWKEAIEISGYHEAAQYL